MSHATTAILEPLGLVHTSASSLRDELVDLHAHFCRGIGDPKRLLIIASLKNGEQTVGQLAQEIGATHSNTSQHLTTMRDLGLVVARRVDSNVYYRLSDPRLADVVELLRVIRTDLRNQSNITPDIRTEGRTESARWTRTGEER